MMTPDRCLLQHGLEMNKRWFPTLLLILLVGCSSDSSGPVAPEHQFEPTPPVNPQPAGNRLYGITVSESTNGFQADFQVARQSGLQVVELPLDWNVLEPTAGNYQDSYGLLGATAFYAANDISLLLTLSVINTVASTTPDYLDSYAWDAPEMMAAFNNLLDWVFSQLPADLDVVGVSVGNEVNFVLTDEQWAPYTAFVDSAAVHLHALDPSLKVGVKTTVTDGLFGIQANHIRALNDHTDVVMLNYYLMDNHFQVRAPLLVHNDFSTLTGDFPGRVIWMTEVGYQSGSEYCHSSEEQQAAFFHELFTAWDTHRSNIALVMVDWLNDASPAQLTAWEQYYGLSDPAFLEYLGTLGLRTHDGRNKPAWSQLLAETGARGWGPETVMAP